MLTEDLLQRSVIAEDAIHQQPDQCQVIGRGAVGSLLTEFTMARMKSGEITAVLHSPTTTSRSLPPKSAMQKSNGISKRTRIYAQEDIATHVDSKSCWITRAGKVYDVTGFLQDHPGGDDLILQYAGKDVDEVMKDSEEHDHSDSAYDMLEEYVIGRLGTGEATVSEGTWLPVEWEAQH